MGGEGKASETRGLLEDTQPPTDTTVDPDKGKEKNAIEGSANAFSEEQQNADEHMSKSQRDDAFILKSLLSGKAVKDSLSHDAVINEANQESVLLEMEGIALP